MESSVLFHNIKEASEQLNQAIARVNKLIDKAENEILQHNVGYEVWCEGYINFCSSKNIPNKSVITTFGWAKHKGKWQFVLHRYLVDSNLVKFQHGDKPIIQWPQGEIPTPEEVLSLREGTKEERLFAVEYMEELSDRISNYINGELGLYYCVEERMKNGPLADVMIYSKKSPEIN